MGEFVLNHRHPSLTRSHPDFNAVTVRRPDYTISAIFPFFRGDGSSFRPAYAPRVDIGICADSEDVLDHIEHMLENEVFIQPVESPASK